ncbi:hypothetical protein NBH00_16140 [Paraconexibacter antarcticus]|uniref:SGNH domain-containing protein n=1 Tax=Paraconexibacter antarcticus TaxID=2949664 RepID=A0ABY5DLW8_9ACTN|nr:SGNH hydrolase domain-containing protein [Paraconexibacter antarcticus]UTI62886.1 hypothetical protein NBH00_16140 [Paraconexibacter antarcticus]
MRVPSALRTVVFLVVVAAVTAALVARLAGSGDDGAAPAGPGSTIAVAPAAPRDPARPTPAPAQAPTPAPAPLLPDARTPLPAIVRSPCFGAASEDPRAPCRNLRLATTVFPTPATAKAAQRQEGCRRSYDDGLLRICLWGAVAAPGRRTVALVGDSHASHWRAALGDVVRTRGWRAVSISRAGCPLTLARPLFRRPGQAAQCEAWNRQVQRWIAAHRAISVVFTGAHRIRVVPAGGETAIAARRAGYVRAWHELLRSSGVRHVVVLRDTPRTTAAALTCVGTAVATHADAGAECALPRRVALPPDPASRAARSLRSPQIQVADLSRFFCGPAVCRPVIGGALVLRDVSHMTTTFSATLGPYLLRTVDRLATAWPAAAKHALEAAALAKARTATTRPVRAARARRSSR